MKEQMSFDELSELIVTAIKDDNFFNKATLIPKIKAIIRAFKVNMSVANYAKIEKPTDSAKRLREIEKLELEKNFWQRRCKEIYGENEQLENYKRLNELHIKHGFKPQGFIPDNLIKLYGV